VKEKRMRRMMLERLGREDDEGKRRIRRKRGTGGEVSEGASKR